MGNCCASLSPCFMNTCPESITHRCCSGYRSRIPAEDDEDNSLYVRQIPVGSMVQIYKQDPSIKTIGLRMKWLPLDIKDGPSSDDVVIRGVREAVKPTDQERNFLYLPDKDPVEFDAVHVFAVVTSVLHMYRRALRRLGVTQNLQWQWGNDPIRVYPRAGELQNAMYSRQHRGLVFYYFKDPDSGEYIYTGRSFDVVAHETGHAILDSIKPDYSMSEDTETEAFHESFGDLTAIFALLDDLEMCEAIIAHSKGNLHNHSFFAVIGEEFGQAIGRNFGLRNADENLRIDQVSAEAHDLSRVFTSAMYDILVDMYDMTRNIEKFNPAETLFRIGKHLCGVFITAIMMSPSAKCRFSEVANNMIKQEKIKEYKSVMTEQFGLRKFQDLNLHNLTSVSESKHICATMQVASNIQLAQLVEETCSAISTTTSS